MFQIFLNQKLEEHCSEFHQLKKWCGSCVQSVTVAPFDLSFILSNDDDDYFDMRRPMAIGMARIVLSNALCSSLLLQGLEMSLNNPKHLYRIEENPSEETSSEENLLEETPNEENPIEEVVYRSENVEDFNHHHHPVIHSNEFDRMMMDHTTTDEVITADNYSVDKDLILSEDLMKSRDDERNDTIALLDENDR